MSQSPKLQSSKRCFGGAVNFYSHTSEVCKCEMKFSVFSPPLANTQNVPILYWLSGLTCTEENFMAKAGAQKYAAQHNIMLVAPDTSPRGCNIPGEDDSWDFGTGAGFYVDATTDKWSANYHMYSYVTQELPAIIHEHFPGDPSRQGIFGHSMGGHGALIVALKNSDKYLSASAFAPICAPSQCPWGKKAFTNYLGKNQQDWALYDANELVRTASKKLPLLIDQGTEDSFLEEQLQSEILRATCEEIHYPLTLRMQEGYDHSYYFIASFMEDHIVHHAKVLNQS